MKFDILNHWTGAVQFTAEIGCSKDDSPSVKIGLAAKWAFENGADLRGADLRGADLRGADLWGADLRDADLWGANLWGANLRDADLWGAKYGDGIPITMPPLQVMGLEWPVLILDRHMKIGCEIHGLAEWEGFDDRRILAMDGKTALTFWRQNKEALLAMARIHGRDFAAEEKEKADA